MDYTQNMNLTSPTGYAMPFNDPKDNPRILLDYGTQKHPKTGEDFHHSGIDFAAKNIDLYAVGSGVVTGTNTDTKRGFVLTIKYDDYEVTYSPIMLSTVQFGNKVKGGQKVAVSGNFLHIGVKFKDEEINPKDFLQMIYGNMLVHHAEENPGTAPVGYNEGKIVTSYDKDHDEIEGLFGNFMGSYFKDMATGKYKIPESTTEGIKDLFGQAKQENLFFQSMPSMMNPLGFGASAYGLIGQMMNLLIGDFLQYLAMQHRVFLSSWSDEQKKVVRDAVEEQNESSPASGSPDGKIIDPLQFLNLDIQSFDIPRLVSIYPDRFGIHWWIKSWFNGHKRGEKAIGITIQQVISFLHDRTKSKDDWLEEYYPKQMQLYHQAMEQTTQQLLQAYNIQM